MFLNLEGLHGVGKSTILEKIPEYMQETRREYDATTTSLDGRYLFYLSGIFVPLSRFNVPWMQGSGWRRKATITGLLLFMLVWGQN
jgi:hypothetical protein